MGLIAGINHVTFAVTDLDRSLRFYVEVLGCRAVARWKRGAYLEAGTLWLCLSLDEGMGATPATGATHVALSVDTAGLGALHDRLVAAGVRQWRANRSEGESLYILDPDGHQLELHVGDLRSRLAACREAPYDEMEIFG